MDEKKKILIAIPCYQGLVHMKCMEQCMELIQELPKLNIDYEFFSITVDSLIPRARNISAMKFLKSDCTHLLFIDADIIFTPNDVIKLLEANKPIICGTYPKKCLDFNLLKQNILLSESLEHLISRSVNYALNFFETPKNQPVIEVMDAPTGFMLIRKNVFFQMINTFPDIRYKNDINVYKQYEYKEFFYDFFQTGVFEHRYLSEDFGFCRKLQELKIPIYVDLSVNLIHVGNFYYFGCPLKRYGLKL